MFDIQVDMNMLLFRVDKRVFKKGDIITPKTEYVSQLSPAAKEVEEMLDSVRKESVPERKNCLFLFENLSSALKFYSKYAGCIIYAVAIDSSFIYHRADMNIIDNIIDVFQNIEDCSVRQSIVRKYWEDGTHVFQPCYEFLVKEACVHEIVIGSDQHDCLCEQIKKYISIEKTPLFKELIQKY